MDLTPEVLYDQASKVRSAALAFLNQANTFVSTLGEVASLHPGITKSFLFEQAYEAQRFARKAYLTANEQHDVAYEAFLAQTDGPI